MNGYMGGILKIDLSSGVINSEVLDGDFARIFLGGNGFAAKIIYDLVPYQADPISEDNIVVFATGPLNETPVWGTGRGHLASISPQSGMFFDSNFGGNFASMLKRTGFDAVVISGKAASPVYILIKDGEVTLKDAHSLWGKSTEETHRLLVEEEGEGIESAVIGPAGENNVIFAGVMVSGSRRSAAARGGIGAVLGSKNLKAVVAKGSKKVEIADREGLKGYLRPIFPGVKEKAKALTTYGTSFLVDMINSKGMLCTHNNTREIFDHAREINGEVILEKYIKKSVACRGCPVACGKIVYVPHGEFAGQNVKMPEYETLYSMGSMLDNSDIVSIFNGNAMCDSLGMDTISLGSTLAFVAECVEKGIVSEEELGGKISFGDGAYLTDIIKKTAHKKGVGEFLALGSKRLASLFGGDSDRFLHSVKGLEMAGHSARGLRPMALAYATSTRGGSHHDARPVYLADDPQNDPGFDGQPEYCVNSQHNTAVGDSLVICRFLQERAFGGQLNDSLVPVIRYVTGWDIDLDELNMIGERIYNLERMINVKRGVNRSMDTLPYRVMNEPIPDGPSKGRYCPKEELDKMLDAYYRLRGWDEDGIPSSGKLSELGLV
ncbi:MAG: aldehyde ferredoxin oxidoreductase family protein [Thermodesulfobacteriota bacterium]|nr:aldehyde ferredoxin oxidoreductase family protein [Thermodesulfobacteriota bacterium]